MNSHQKCPFSTEKMSVKAVGLKKAALSCIPLIFLWAELPAHDLHDSDVDHYRITQSGSYSQRIGLTDILFHRAPTSIPKITTSHMDNGKIHSNGVSVNWRYGSKHLLKFNGKIDNFSSGRATTKFGAGYQLDIGSAHAFGIKNNYSLSDLGKTTESYRIYYHVNPGPNHVLKLQSQYKFANSDKLKTLYVVHYKFGLPKSFLPSSIHFRIESTPSIKTQLETKFHASKNFTFILKTPVKVSGNIKWRKLVTRENSEHGYIGGQLLTDIQLTSDLYFRVSHTFKDVINKGSTALSGKYKTNFDGNDINIKFGAKNNSTIYVSIQSML